MKTITNAEVKQVSGGCSSCQQPKPKKESVNVPEQPRSVIDPYLVDENHDHDHDFDHQD